jgi:hypothetical protein
MTTLSDDPNAAKASFDEIYAKPDPRAYFSVLGSLDYAIPDLAKPIFKQIAAAWRADYGGNATLLDLGSSYGINAALFRFPLSFGMLRRRYAQRAILNLASEQVQALDQNYFKAWPRTQPERIVVADVSEPAVAYAVRAGLADIGIAGSFERGAPSESAAKVLPDVDIIMSTGCVGYVTERTFQTLMDSSNRPPWVVSFVLRMFDYAPIEATLASAGLVTEKLNSAAFVQRRFRDEEEAHRVLSLLSERGLDPTGLEAEGLLFAELYLSRPRADVERRPLDSIVTVASGRNLSFGPRLVRVNRGAPSELAAVRL